MSLIPGKLEENFKCKSLEILWPDSAGLDHITDAHRLTAFPPTRTKFNKNLLQEWLILDDEH